MSELLWRCEEGSLFTTEMFGLELAVIHAPMGRGYRYQLLRPSSTDGVKICLASGHRDDLREAIAAAERSARGFTAPVPGADRARRGEPASAQ